MTLVQFYEYDHEEQVVILKQATFLAERKDRHFRYQLFQLDSFYIEVRYSLFYNINKELFAFHNIDFLQPYLVQIDIPKIF